MDRRKFLWACIASSVVIPPGAWWINQRANARSKLFQELRGNAIRLAVQPHGLNMDEISANVRKKFYLWMHGKCLNAHSFVQEISTVKFRHHLDSLSDNGTRDKLIANEFARRVVTMNQLWDYVASLLRPVGLKLTNSWRELEVQVAEQWAVRLATPSNQFVDSLTDAVQLEFMQVIENMVGNVRIETDPSSRMRAMDIFAERCHHLLGRTSIDVSIRTPGKPPPLPQVHAKGRGDPMVIPIFVLDTMRFIRDLIMGSPLDTARLQQRITAEMSTFARRAGQHLEVEVKGIIGLHHDKQMAAIDMVARDISRQTVPWLGFSSRA